MGTATIAKYGPFKYVGLVLVVSSPRVESLY